MRLRLGVVVACCFDAFQQAWKVFPIGARADVVCRLAFCFRLANAFRLDPVSAQFSFRVRKLTYRTGGQRLRCNLADYQQRQNQRHAHAENPHGDSKQARKLQFNGQEGQGDRVKFGLRPRHRSGFI